MIDIMIKDSTHTIGLVIVHSNPLEGSSSKLDDSIDVYDINGNKIIPELLAMGMAVALIEEAASAIGKPYYVDGETLQIPYEDWFPRKDFSEIGLVWYNKDFNLDKFLSENYAKEKDLVLNRSIGFNDYEILNFKPHDVK